MYRVTPKICRLLVICLLLFCGIAQAKESGLQKVTLQLRWMPQFQFAGYYMADAKGFYRDEGIEIEIIPGNGNRTQVMEEVISGRADFGIGNSGLVLASMRSQPITVVADIFQRSAAVLIVRPGLEKSILDLSNRNLALRSLEDNPELYAVFNNYGISPSSLPRLSTGTYGFDEFISGKADAINAYISNEPYLLKKKNIPFRLIDPDKYGIDFYGDALFSTSAYIKNNPGLVKKFVRASIKGWVYAIENEDEAIRYIQENISSNKTADHLRYEAKIIKDLIMPDYIPIGNINENRWNKIALVFKELGLAAKEDQINPEFFPSHWEKRAEGIVFWRYVIAISLFVMLIMIGGGWYYRANKQLKALLLEKNKLLEAVEKLANYDFLTKLPNRRLIYDRMERAIKIASRNHQKLAISILDLNGFKKINDEFGHQIGDEVLIEAAKRFSDWVRGSDSLGRIGGDEFLICIENIQNRDALNALYVRLQTAFEAPFLIDGYRFNLSFSLGSAFYPDDAITLDELIQIADENMYKSKKKMQSVLVEGLR